MAAPSRNLAGPLRRRREAALAGHRGDHATARALLDDEDAEVRATALGALWRTGTLQPAEVRAGLSDPAPTVRRRTLEVVGALRGDGPARAVPILALLDDPDPSVVEVAAWASGEREPAESGAVARLAALADRHQGAGDALVREAAVAALGAIGDPAGLAAVLAATADKATVRRRAVLALAPFEGPEVEAALARAADDRDWQVRQAAEDLRA